MGSVTTGMGTPAVATPAHRATARVISETSEHPHRITDGRLRIRSPPSVKCSMWIGQPGGIHPTFPGFHVVNGAMIVLFWRLSNGISRIARAAGGRNRQLTVLTTTGG